MEEPDKDFLDFVVEKFKKYGVSEEMIRKALKEGQKQVLESILAQKQKKWDKCTLEKLEEEFKEKNDYKNYNPRKYFEELCSKKVY